jgi:pimeloyl-ACP methyl ester carboxylesterase
VRAQPYRLHVDQHTLDDLEVRLERARLPNATADAQPGWDLGTSPAFLGELVRHWRNGYEWRHHESKLNAYAQYRADVEGANLHFIHVKGRGPEPMPLVLLHGWPDSFFRFHKVIGPLSDPAGAGGDARDAFDVVVPSLPGFPLTGPVHRGTDRQPNRQTARWIWQLMTDVLGYKRFAVAGGDGGSAIAQILALDHPTAVVGIHLTDLAWHATSIDPSSLTHREQHYVEEALHGGRRVRDGAIDPAT